MEPFSFSSLHEYLDCAFKDNPNPSWDEIKNAKKEYWKIYYKHYRREKRIKRKEFSLGFYPKQLTLIHQKRGGKSISKFLYDAVNTQLTSQDAPQVDTKVFSEVHQQLRTLINLMEESLDNEASDALEEMLERFEKIEDSFLKLLNP
ncbi:hypothetical protein [Olleya sp. UBA1516]|uniref:hypothetical protein n=1 Tax=Olleya sp. UBA1516 TaxID=1947013 RepID=UPI002600593B|nr:hypothetical protein [Olleya sp. UBA1516]|tara:strand:- start:3012 stop:3452 length:441 start_codon:yes stop_codon:yes gene_type:complete